MSIVCDIVPGTDGLLKYAFAILKHCVDTMNSINILVVAFQYLGFAISIFGVCGFNIWVFDINILLPRRLGR